MEQPVIKWSGSKRKAANQLAQLVPPHNNYFEPFLGGGALIPQVKPCAGTVSDILPELMELWHLIRNEPDSLSAGYRNYWHGLQKSGHLYYYEVRDFFNETRDPIAFLFLSRTCVNGLIRFNSKGEFNNSLHHTRPGIHPDRLDSIIARWSKYVAPLNLATGDYKDILSLAQNGDFVFLDPPYVGNKGRYLPGTIDFGEFVQTLGSLSSRGVMWMVTLDGSAGSRNYEELIPNLGATSSFHIGTGHSPFTRLMKSSLDVISESVHLNFEPASKTTALLNHEFSNPGSFGIVS